MVVGPHWQDNVARMHQFRQQHPEVKVTVPLENGTDEFTATWPGGQLSDRSLGWLMDNLEKQFRET